MINYTQTRRKVYPTNLERQEREEWQTEDKLSTLKMETMENEIKDRWRRRFDKIFNGTTMVSSSVNDLL